MPEFYLGIFYIIATVYMMFISWNFTARGFVGILLFKAIPVSITGVLIFLALTHYGFILSV